MNTATVTKSTRLNERAGGTVTSPTTNRLVASRSTPPGLRDTNNASGRATGPGRLVTSKARGGGSTNLKTQSPGSPGSSVGSPKAKAGIHNNIRKPKAPGSTSGPGATRSSPLHKSPSSSPAKASSTRINFGSAGSIGSTSSSINKSAGKPGHKAAASKAKTLVTVSSPKHHGTKGSPTLKNAATVQALRSTKSINKSRYTNDVSTLVELTVQDGSPRPSPSDSVTSDGNFPSSTT